MNGIFIALQTRCLPRHACGCECKPEGLPIRYSSTLSVCLSFFCLSSFTKHSSLFFFLRLSFCDTFAMQVNPFLCLLPHVTLQTSFRLLNLCERRFDGLHSLCVSLFSTHRGGGVRPFSFFFVFKTFAVTPLLLLKPVWLCFRQLTDMCSEARARRMLNFGVSFDVLEHINNNGNSQP